MGVLDIYEQRNLIGLWIFFLSITLSCYPRKSEIELLCIELEIERNEVIVGESEKLKTKENSVNLGWRGRNYLALSHNIFRKI